LFDLKARFFVPTRGPLTSSRAGAVKVGRRAKLAACSELARPYLDSFEHDGTLGAIGMTIRGEPAFGRGSVAPQPCIRWVQGPEPWCSHTHRQRSSEAADPFSFSALKAKETRRDSATSNRHRRPVTSGRTGPKLLGVLQW